VGKTNQSIDEEYTTITIYFIDGTPLEMSAYGDPVFVKVIK